MTDNHSIRFQDFGISEEILGAYLEGNLTDYEHSFVETILQSDDGLKEFISEVTNDFIYKSNAFDEEISMNFNSFQLPEISGTDPINTDSDVSSFNYHGPKNQTRLTVVCQRMMITHSPLQITPFF